MEGGRAGVAVVAEGVVDGWGAERRDVRVGGALFWE